MAERLRVQLPLSGPLAVKYKIEGDTQALRLEQINLSAGRVDDIQVNAQGRVLFGKWAQADPVQSIDLHVQAKSHATREPAAAFGLKLPELGALSAKGRLHTVSGTHRIDDFLVETGKGAPLKASLAGTAAQVAFFPQFKVGGISGRNG